MSPSFNARVSVVLPHKYVLAELPPTESVRFNPDTFCNVVPDSVVQTCIAIMSAGKSRLGEGPCQDETRGFLRRSPRLRGCFPFLCPSARASQARGSFVLAVPGAPHRCDHWRTRPTSHLRE